ncbi:unnamed protein product [Acanthoscelides obtectus]|uniref:Uncharacterized protein n=1 Tax=Acanthoscelides obtectus TaxID=200917 RepID=A0A9P0L6M0_ACAOB|nr:unnamed protein product [Acanthoscelides obtectus]CAK1675189.1 hypothetical protein AOBTE_LOCUS30046 [Acanthoscelides obtectus]
MANIQISLIILIILHSVAGLKSPYWECQYEQFQNTEPCQTFAKLKLPSSDSQQYFFQDVQRRNSEISSALNDLYGNNGRGGFPGKRNPELSSALLHYINSNKGYNKLYK